MLYEGLNIPFQCVQSILYQILYRCLTICTENYSSRLTIFTYKKYLDIQHVFRLKIIKLHQRQTKAKYLTWYAFQDSFTTLWWVKSNFRTWRRRYRIRILSSNDKQSLYDSQGDKFSCIFPKITSYFWGLLNQVYNTSTINIKLLTLNNKMNLTPFFITK